MKSNILNTVLSIVFLVIALILAGFLYQGVRGPIQQKQEIAAIEKAIIEKLKLIRELEIAYQSQNGKYAGRWEELVSFAQSGDILNIQKIEKAVLEDGDGQEKIEIVYDTLGTIPVRDSILPENYDASRLPYIPGTDGKKFTLYASEINNGGVDINVFEVRDEYPVNPARGGELKENGEPYSVTRLITYFQDKLKTKREEAVEIQKKIRDAASEADKEKFQEELDDLSKFINLYEKRIEQLQTKPLKVGSRDEATTAGNWE